MGFSVEIDYLIVNRGDLIVTPIPADKTTISPPKLKRNWDVQKGYGIQGASCTYTGEGLATFDAMFEFWHEERELQWNIFAAAYLTPPVGKQTLVLGVYHPILVQPPFLIQNVVVTDIEGWSLVTPGHWQTRLSFMAYRPPKKFPVVKAEPGVPPTEKKPIAKPKTENDLRIEAAAAKLKEAAEAGVRRR